MATYFMLFVLTATFYYVGKMIVEEEIEDDASYDKAMSC